MGGLLDVRPDERRRAALLFAWWFLVIAAYWVLKPLRTARFIQVAGVAGLPLVKLGVAAVVLPVVLVYSWASARVRRGRLVALCGVTFAALSLAFRAAWSGGVPASAAWAFFFFVDVYNTVMVALFWSYLADTTAPEDAKRLYGPIGAGGIVGGAAGAALTGWAVRALGAPNLLLVAAALIAAAVAVVAALERERPGGVARDAGGGSGLRAAVEGASLIVGSRYLLGMVAVVALYEMISVIVDYQFNAAAAAHFGADETGFTAFTAKLNAALIAVAAAVQALATSWVQRRLGMLVALSLLPAALMGGSALYLLVPTLGAATVLFASDGTLAYSLHQASREALYTPETAQAKYRAKAFIDMFAMRAAKGVAALLIVGLNLLAVSPRFLSLVSAGVLVAWWLAIRTTARSFELRTRT